MRAAIVLLVSLASCQSMETRTESPLGGPCAGTADCVVGLQCYLQVPMGECSKECQSDAICLGGVCGSADGRCHPGCASPSDCARGEPFRCIPAREGYCSYAAPEGEMGANHCADEFKDGDETDINCGGALCPPCGVGKRCLVTVDCASMSCVAKVCSSLPANCTDGKRDGDETDIDCGGATCMAPCGANRGCQVNKDCQSGACVLGVCDSCFDKRKDGDESDIDCGGVHCAGCGFGMGCLVNGDCASKSCIAGACSVPATCNDKKKDGSETDIDCGGLVCMVPCGPDQSCLVDADCRSARCRASHCDGCEDNKKDGAETDVDCGGVYCGPCGIGMHCVVDRDCAAMTCVKGTCKLPASCSDGIKNGDETDIDCGGTTCMAPCAALERCLVNGDCVSFQCSNGRCSSCGDGLKNVNETDIDCGGPDCDPCRPGELCKKNGDCDMESNGCSAGQCACPPGNKVWDHQCLCDSNTCNFCCTQFPSPCGTPPPDQGWCTGPKQVCSPCHNPGLSCLDGMCLQWCDFGCQGCCAGESGTKVCVGGGNGWDKYCGLNGAACVSCPEGQHCLDGVCSAPLDGGVPDGSSSDGAAADAAAKG